MTDQSRRSFLKNSGIATIGFLGLQQFVSNPLFASQKGWQVSAGYGPLLPDPKGILNLPAGFSYNIISKRGDKMSDGLFLPGRPDGMGAFRGKNGKTIVVRNHENSPDAFDQSAFGAKNELFSKVSRDKFYDYGKGELPCLGGTSTFVYDPATKKIESQYLSLAGTARNCAGGPTPWNTWITCEEFTLKAGAMDNRLEKDHGYVFEVPAFGKPGLCDPIAIKAMGRMNHEAVAVDPGSSIVYLTEDAGDSLIYRYLPDVPGKLSKGGRLQALTIQGHKSYDTRNLDKLTTPKFPLRQFFNVEWINVENVESPENDLRTVGFAKGAACFARGEGMWFGKNELYFACTNGGPTYTGQVFRYVPGKYEGKTNEKEHPGKLELFAETTDTDLLKSCDNLTVAPWGDVVLCEDDPHPFIVGITPGGQFYKIAENVGFKSEFAGGVFSPGGETYFVNIQEAGLTFAITGPWKK